MYNNVTNKYKTFIKYKQNIYKNFNKKCSQFLGTATTTCICNNVANTKNIQYKVKVK